ncbi:hypothetical protein HA073_20870 [Micromonospora sp. CMU55-4]|nr:hypothetical protein [Micromonospora sp. CMU55-4]
MTFALSHRVDGDAGRWRYEGFWVFGADAVEAQQDVEVHGCAALHLGDLAVRQPHRRHPADLAGGGDDADLRDAALAARCGEVAVERLLGASPQLAGEVVPDDLVGVDVAVQAQRQAQPRIVGVVTGEAHHGLPVRADAGVAAGAAGRGSAVAALPAAAGVAADVPVVNRAEGRGGEGGEDDRVPADRGGNALAAGQSATDDLVRVASVDPGAVPADRIAAVTARLVERAVGQFVGVLLAEDSAGVAVDGGDGAGEADRAGAAAGGAGVLQPAGELRRSDAMQDLDVTTGGEAGAVGGEDGCLLLRGWQGRETKHHQPWTDVRWWCSSCLLAPPRGRLTPEGGIVVVPLPADGSCPFTLVDVMGRHGWGAWDVGIRRVAAGCPTRGDQRSRAIVDGREGRAGPINGFRNGTAAGAIESRRDVARISGRKAT